jgi:N-acetylneuraminate synthase
MTKIYLIAEAGVNHNGSLDRALEMIDTAATCGADAVKFQTFRAEALASSTAAMAPYQAKRLGENGGQLAMLKALELSTEAHFVLLERCRAQRMDFLSTPFDCDSLEFLVNEIGVKAIKLGSGEITNGPLLMAAGRSRRPVILSTGMSTLEEVKTALGVLAHGALGRRGQPTPETFRALADDAEARRILASTVTLLHCTSAYPTPAAEVNLRAMVTMAQELSLPVGLSDHTQGIAAAIAAAALGATMIEKHFTLDRMLPGPDHQASLEPRDLSFLFSAVRDVEIALGDGIKQPTASEGANMPHARRSLVTTRAIRRGETFNEASLIAKRPATGASPLTYWSWIGRVAERDYDADEVVDL